VNYTQVVVHFAGIRSRVFQPRTKRSKYPSCFDRIHGPDYGRLFIRVTPREIRGWERSLTLIHPNWKIHLAQLGRDRILFIGDDRSSPESMIEEPISSIVYVSFPPFSFYITLLIADNAYRVDRSEMTWRKEQSCRRDVATLYRTGPGAAPTSWYCWMRLVRPAEQGSSCTVAHTCIISC